MEEIVRKIIHIDMDAFFASIEQRDFPELKGKPVAVGSGSERGVIAAASYEARKYGVKSAMSSRVAKNKCPDLIFKPHRFDVYKSVSKQIMDILSRYSDIVEPLSIDEAFLDVTANKLGHKTVTEIAKSIKKEIKSTTELTASAGLSINKFLAKTASDMDKPDGLYIIRPHEALSIIAKMPVNKIYGIGKVTAKKMNSIGIYTGFDLRAWSIEGLINKFGNAGVYFYNISRGIDEREVKPKRERKSIGTENTFKKDIFYNDELIFELKKIVDDLWSRIQKINKYGRTITLKIKYNDFKQITRSVTIDNFFDNKNIIYDYSMKLLMSIDIIKPIRLMGVSISNFKIIKLNPGYKQLSIDF